MAPLSRDVSLPEPRTRGDLSLEEAIARRRSVRSFRSDPLDLATVGQLLWSAQGETSPDGLRAAPSAGATYPLELLLVAGAVDGLAPAIYRYRPHRHLLEGHREGDHRAELARAAWNQDFIAEAPATIAIAAVFSRTTPRYGKRGERYVHMDAAHAAENLHLQVVPLGLGTVVVGAFDDWAVSQVLGLAGEEEPLVLLPVGKPR
jgi:SagB-type dehydrogenase family enzyme